MALMWIKCFTFLIFPSVPALSASFPFISAFLQQPPLHRTAMLPSALFHAHCVVFFSLLSVFLSFPHLSSHYCTDGGQMLAGMIAEPAFLSEYTIFALDHSNRPKTAQVASVVSLSSLPASSSSSSSCPVPSSRLLRLWGIDRGLWPGTACSLLFSFLFALDLATRRHLVCELNLHLVGDAVYRVE